MRNMLVEEYVVLIKNNVKGFLFLHISLALFLWLIENNKPYLVEGFKGQARASLKSNSNLICFGQKVDNGLF